MDRSRAELISARDTSIGLLKVRRSLPTRARRNVGAWCFADHLGPLALRPGERADVAPHPHCGLQTVTWLFEGEFLHRDSLGSEQAIRPGQLNLMSAGRGVAHAEEDPDQFGHRLHGIQLWVAQPDATRCGPADFEHHDALPRVELDAGVATMLLGTLHGVNSPARRDDDLVGAELQLSVGTSVLEASELYEYGVIGIAGEVLVDGAMVVPGSMAYLAPGRGEVVLTALNSATVMLVGGVALSEPLVMWWNFVARSRDEIVAAYNSWSARDERFGPVVSRVSPIDVAPPAWLARGS